MAGRRVEPQGFARPVGERSPSDHSCSAFGCPLADTFTPSTKGGPGWCFVHSAAPALDAQEITRRIRQREWLWRLIAWVDGMDRGRYERKTWRPRIAARLAEQGHADLEPGATESKYAYIARLRGVMLIECTAGLRERAATHQGARQPDDAGWLALQEAFNTAIADKSRAARTAEANSA